MKALILFLILVCPAFAGAPKQIDISGYTAFSSLSKESASSEGTKTAQSDFKKGLFRILIYGEAGSLFPTEIYLQKNYGVEPLRIAYCVVTEGLVSGADQYNKTMQSLLNRKFGKDIFEEAKLKTK